MIAAGEVVAAGLVRGLVGGLHHADRAGRAQGLGQAQFAPPLREFRDSARGDPRQPGQVGRRQLGVALVVVVIPVVLHAWVRGYRVVPGELQVVRLGRRSPGPRRRAAGRPR